MNFFNIIWLGCFWIRTGFSVLVFLNNSICWDKSDKIVKSHFKDWIPAPPFAGAGIQKMGKSEFLWNHQISFLNSAGKKNVNSLYFEYELCLGSSKSPYQPKKHTENGDLNNPTDKTDSDCAPSTFIVKRLSDGNDHRYQHPDADDEIEDGPQHGDNSQNAQHSRWTGEPDGAQQLPIVCLCLWFR